MKLKTFVVAGLLVLVIIVVFQNTEVVETKFLFASLSMPRALLLLLTLLVGIVVGLILATRLPSASKGNK